MADSRAVDSKLSGCLHPSTLLLAWISGIVAIQCVSSPLPTFLTIAGVVLFFSREEALTLLCKSKWLLLSLALMFAFLTPGSESSGWLGRVGMTDEGLTLAFRHLLSLLSIIGLVALLLTRVGAAQLIAGLNRLFGPLALFGFDPLRISVRLMLTLQYAGISEPKMIAVQESNNSDLVLLLIDSSQIGPSAIDAIFLAAIFILMIFGFLSPFG